jgi:hypothetical protein
MSYQIQVFHPTAGAYVPTRHTSDDLTTLRRMLASGRFSFPTRIVDGSGTTIAADTPADRRTRPLMLDDIARIMGVQVVRKPPDA